MTKVLENKKSETITQMYFEFRHWKECFQKWKDIALVHGDENMQMVISTHPYTSGYYIEKFGTKLTDSDICYTGKQVDKLEKRIIKEHHQAEKQERGVKFTL